MGGGLGRSCGKAATEGAAPVERRPTWRPAASAHHRRRSRNGRGVDRVEGDRIGGLGDDSQGEDDEREPNDFHGKDRRQRPGSPEARRHRFVKSAQRGPR